MLKLNFKRTLGAVLLAATVLLSFAFTGCNKPEDKAPADFSVSVATEGSMPFSKLMLRVYGDAEKTDLVWAGETDKDGKVSFTAASSEGLFAFLENVPEDYEAEEFYTLAAGETSIVLKAVIKEGGLSDTVFERGSVIRDFTVNADGKEYKISELLKEKDAVVLNFWFLNCGPCRSEFPHMQSAYEKYSDKIELLALNPYDGTENEVKDFAADNGYTFPVAKCGEEFIGAFEITSYPTTVVIDRYGVICMVYTGAIPDAETFEKLFAHFTADDYTQKIIRNISDIEN